MFRRTRDVMILVKEIKLAVDKEDNFTFVSFLFKAVKQDLSSYSWIKNLNLPSLYHYKLCGRFETHVCIFRDFFSPENPQCTKEAKQVDIKK